MVGPPVYVIPGSALLINGGLILDMSVATSASVIASRKAYRLRVAPWEREKIHILNVMKDVMSTSELTYLRFRSALNESIKTTLDIEFLEEIRRKWAEYSMDVEDYPKMLAAVSLLHPLERKVYGLSC